MRFLICAAALAANPAFAECIDGSVTDLAHTIIAQRGELPGLASRRFGGLEAYMLLRYGSELAEVQAELDASGGKPSSDAPFVFEQYALSQNADPDFASLLPDRAARPITVQDLLPFMHGEVAVALVDFLATDTNRYLMPGALGGAALLLPEETRLSLATQAEDAGNLLLAADLLLSLPDRDAFLSFNSRTGFTQANRDWFLNNPLVYLQNKDPIMFTGTGVPLEFEIRRGAIIAAQSKTTYGTYLELYVNYIGDLDEAARVANALLADFDAGQVDPMNETAIWAFVYQTLMNGTKAANLPTTFDTVEVPAGEHHYAGSLLKVYEWASAIEAMRPYVSGEGDLPPAPGHIGKYVDWNQWSNVAEAVRTGSYSELTAELAPVTFELLWTKGDQAAAIEFAKGIADPKLRLDIMRDAMKRSDAECKRAAFMAGQAQLLYSATPIRFETSE